MLYRGKRVRERGRLPKGKFPKKGGRRLVSGLLALVLCLTLVPVIYADTVVTVTSWYAAGAFEENTLYWVDNNNEDGVRPGANTYQPSLWFRIDNGEWIELKGGEDSTLSGVGLSAMPKMTVADNGNNTYTVSVPAGVLPEAIETTTSDGYGGETSTESRVEWIMGPSEGVDGYSPVEVNNGNVSEYPSAGDNYGWYYVLEDEFNFRVQLRWGNLGGAEGIAEAIYNSFDFVVDTNYTASSLRRLLAEMKDQMKIEEDPDGDPDNPTSGTVTVSGLWKYNLDGSRINYSVEETREGDGKGDGRLDAAEGRDTQHHIVTQAFFEQRQNICRLTAFEVDKDGGDNLRVLVADKVGGTLRLHKVERFDTAGGIARFQNVFQQAGGTLFAQRLDQHGAQVVVGVDVQRGKLFGFLFKLCQHFGQLLVGDLTHVGHGRTENLHFSLGEVFKHLCRTIFANGHQQDDAFIGARKRITHVRYPSTGG